MPPLSTSLPERGITLPPIRLKRQFDEVDDTSNTTNTPAGDHHDDDHDDRAYDAGESRAGSASPLSVTAPPPTPTSQAQGLKSKTHTPCPSPLNPTVNLNDKHRDGDAAAAGRRASERDAALMLMHMRSGSEDGGSRDRDSGKERGESPAKSEIVVESSAGRGAGGSPREVVGERAIATPLSSMSPKVSSKEPVRGGPVTRAKRRRTLER
jgi:hypothetical protein